MKIACSYNPCFIDGKLIIPGKVELIELGLRAFNKVFSEQKKFNINYNKSLSIHTI